MPKFSKEEMEKYYEVLGINSEKTKLLIEDSIKLSYIGELFELNDFERLLPYTSKTLSDSYSLLIQMIKDGFWYATKNRRLDAFNYAHEIIDELSGFDCSDDEDKINNLKTTIINGLCSIDDIIKFRLYQKNASFNSIYSKITDIENEENTKKKLGFDEEDNTPEDLMKLYYLIAYSKFKDDGSDFEMFDGIGNVSLSNLKTMVKNRVKEDFPLNESDEREKITNYKILRLSHYQNK